ncbi:helix-turn-helix domain-containing protein [Paenibacillus sp. LMG 31460]|uniref:Helix-turn-helix domain-containing protein n=1 Tax=Paenibacillus germinis TaxID=2654979 RepID=A0ABX1YZX4_9BACL|nr:AraC family transcriptional regulator [Paenibacillus germinis]NOU85719.1 helix-turn-helix domain-containing protein [Paenibacillus germinis]
MKLQRKGGEGSMYPQYLFEYPNVETDFPFYMKKKKYTSVPSHRHDFIEFSFVLEGKGKERINGTEHDLQPGTIVLLLPYQIHEYEAAPGETLLMYICNFDMKLLTSGLESAWGVNELLFGSNNSRSAHIRLEDHDFEEGLQLWERLYREYESSKAWKPIMLRALLLETLTQFVRGGDKPDGTRIEDQRPKTAKNIWPIVQYVHDHYLEPLTLTSLSKQFQMHPAQISTQFGSEFGIHFVDFLHELRIRHTCSLLISSEMPILQVAFESGFSSYPTFSRAFHRMKGMSPRDYREQQGRER